MGTCYIKSHLQVIYKTKSIPENNEKNKKHIIKITATARVLKKSFRKIFISCQRVIAVWQSQT